MRPPFGRRTLCAAFSCAWLCALAAQATDEPSPAPAPTRIDRVAVASSSLVSIGFAREARTLEIEFRSGAIYRYLGVPAKVFAEFQKAESKGRYFAESIRGKYDFQRIKVASK